MAKILCIPDIHCRKFWRQCVFDNIENVDKIIFLGDYFDPYNEPNLEQDPIKMMNDIINLKKEEPNKYILLLGNHSIHYIWEDAVISSRFDYTMCKKYFNIFHENLEYFNLVWIEDDVIFSHAGISEGWANEFLYHYMKYDEGAELEKSSSIFETARVLKDTPLKDFNNYYIKAISNISHYRGGDMFYGSCEWADLREHIDHHLTEVKEKIIPLGEDGIYQIFGHTQLEKPLITEKWACLDCRRGFIFDTITHECEDCL